MRAARRFSWGAVISVVPAGVPLVVYVEQETVRPLCAGCVQAGVVKDRDTGRLP